MGIISIEQADRLYWLGRYSERVYTTIRLYFNSFDELIDGTGDLYQNFCKMIDRGYLPSHESAGHRLHHPRHSRI